MSVRRTTVFLTAAASAVILALSGCSSDSNDAPSSSSNKGAPAVAGPAQEGGAGAAQDQAQAQAPGEQQKVPDNLDAANRSIIYAGTMTIEVKDVNVAAAQAIAFATAAGGFIGGDNRQINGQSSTATLILRVPAERFQSTLDQLKGVGDEESRQLTSQDVTDQVVDVASRIATAQASVDRIRALLARAQTIGEITALESELSRRESDLESLQARKRKLDGLTALSTITVVMHGPDAPAAPEEGTGILVGLRHGWNAFVGSLMVALTIFGWLLPWLVFVGLPIWLIVWLYKRYRRTHPPAGHPAVAVPSIAVPSVPGPMYPPRPMPQQAGPPPMRAPEAAKEAASAEAASAEAPKAVAPKETGAAASDPPSAH
jgi:hypothetical protein